MIMIKNNYLVLRNAALTNFVVELDCILPYLIIFVTAEGETRSMDSRRRMTTNREIICINLTIIIASVEGKDYKVNGILIRV